ncbi:MAG: hypothetical protein R3B46_07350 [Phycisphaerales bacterium]
MSIPTSELTGTHNIAIFDINQDGYLDMVINRCISTRVWIQVPRGRRVLVSRRYPRFAHARPGSDPGVDIHGDRRLRSTRHRRCSSTRSAARRTTIAMSHLGGDSTCR